MRIRLNSNKQIVNIVREGLMRTGGYCPSRLEQTEATKCMCEEFKAQIADSEFEGFCHCMLYYKSLRDRRELSMPKRYAIVDKTQCVACGVCENTCVLGAVKVHYGCFAVVEENSCVGCGKCANLCPTGSIELKMRGDA